jgi:hypothetical protein
MNKIHLCQAPIPGRDLQNILQEYLPEAVFMEKESPERDQKIKAASIL